MPRRDVSIYSLILRARGTQRGVTVNWIHLNQGMICVISHLYGYVILQHGCYGVSVVTTCVILQHGCYGVSVVTTCVILKHASSASVQYCDVHAVAEQ